MGEQEYRLMFGKSREEAIRETQQQLKEAARKKDRKLVKKLLQQMKEVFIGEDVMQANEVGANLTVATVMLLMALVLVITYVLARAGVYRFDSEAVKPVFVVCIVLLTGGYILNIVFHSQSPWLKYALNSILCLSIGLVTCLLGFRTAISCVLPTILSVRYLNERFTARMSLISGVFVLLSTTASAFLAVSPDLHCLPLAGGTTITVETTIAAAAASLPYDTAAYIRRLLLESYLPNLLQYALIAIVSIQIARGGRVAVAEQAKASAAFTRLDSELNMANHIQTNILPNTFPAFPELSQVEVYAMMNPAREVGGDFYDFFKVDEDTIAFVIADVSGKGIPAALFMMIGRSLIKNEAQMGLSPAEVFTTVNKQLCDDNTSGLFITAWIGMLELSTGKVTACSAGHEYPAICRKGGQFELFKDRHCFVLAGMENILYKQYEFVLNPGDRLFVYTDGVTEATDTQNRLFGTERMLKALNGCGESSQEALLKHVRSEIDAFAGDAPQFDDITMVGISYLE